MRLKFVFGKIFLAALVFAFVLGCGHNKRKVSTVIKNFDSEPIFSPAYMDNSINPGDNFYTYANNFWLKHNPIPEQYSRYSSFEKLEEQNLKQLQELLEDLAKHQDNKNPVYQKIGKFYSCGIDSAKIEKEDISSLKEEFEKIANIKTQKDFQKVLAHMHSIGIYPLFYIFPKQDDKNSNLVIAQLSQGGFGLPDKDYYTGENPRSTAVREEYIKHIVRMFEMLGESSEIAQKSAQKILKIETSLAGACLTVLEQRDPARTYNIFKMDELQKFIPDFNWKDYFANIGLTTDKFNVRQTDFFKEVNQMLKDVSIDDWKCYLKWKLINDASNYISAKFNDEHFHFFGTLLSGNTKQQERWKRVLNITSNLLGEAVGQLYVENYFSPEAKDRTTMMVVNLKDALKDHIIKLRWMSKETKQEALKKLRAMNLKVGYPDKWIDYSNLEVRDDSYVQNVFRANNFLFKRNLNRIGQEVDRAKWNVTPQTINAYYDRAMNEIVIPAAILQLPFFDVNSDDALNYGAIGTVIGHEITHGFDNQGRQYDKLGNFNNWWTDDDSQNYGKQAGEIVDQFNNYTVLDSLHIDGKLTLGENIADLGGVSIAFSALKKVSRDKKHDSIDGFTQEQRFFLSYAQFWKLNIRERELIRRLREDVHSPAEARVNAVVYNIPEFYEAFGIKEGKRFKPVNQRARVW